MLTALRTLGAVAVLALTFYIGVSVGQATFEPQTVLVTETEVEYQPVVRTMVQYVDKPVPVVKYIERVEKVPIELRNFSDLEELKQWLEDKMNVTTIHFQLPSTELDCDDYALDMQHKALADGYIMSFEVIGRSEYNALFETKLPNGSSLHAINSAIIGNDAYYIEPQTGEVAFAVHLD